jgi:hypothetical protein
VEEVKIQGYTDPRTGHYVRATEANRDEVLEGLGFMMAWKFYWDGPVFTNGNHVFDREEWLVSERRSQWLNSLTDEQRFQLEDSFPPEEVVVLEGSS